MLEPIKDIKMCPYCGKWSDARTGFPYLFQSYRMRYHAHSVCHNKFRALHGMFAEPSFGPKPDQLKWIYELPEPEPERLSSDPTPQAQILDGFLKVSFMLVTWLRQDPERTQAMSYRLSVSIVIRLLKFSYGLLKLHRSMLKMKLAVLLL